MKDLLYTKILWERTHIQGIDISVWRDFFRAMIDLILLISRAIDKVVLNFYITS